MEFGKHFQETTIVDGQPTLVKIRHEERIRVKDAKQELAQFMKFRDEHADKLDLCFKIDRTPNGKANGFYYVILCWTDK